MEEMTLLEFVDWLDGCGFKRKIVKVGNAEVQIFRRVK